ncbi:MAG: hypothetical protein KAJ12_11710 [Bacteroidetes bacterium]|nr:hypothetical protein [Bacteroidota bacterium]
MTILGIQNCAAEDFGLIETHLTGLGHEFRVLQAEQEAEYPALEEIQGVVIGGTPISVCAIDDHPFLQKETAFLENAMGANKPCLGVCFGGQALAQLLGQQSGAMSGWKLAAMRCG